MPQIPTTQPRTRLLVDFLHLPGGRLQGHLRVRASDRPTAFSGVLELLRAIEDALDAQATPTVPPGTGAWTTLQTAQDPTTNEGHDHE